MIARFDAIARGDAESAKAPLRRARPENQQLESQHLENQPGENRPAANQQPNETSGPLAEVIIGRVFRRLRARFGSSCVSNAGYPTAHWNLTPIRVALRHTTRHGRLISSPLERTKSSGIPTGLSTSSAAPVSEMFLTTQSTAPPLKVIFAGLRIRRRSTARLLSM